MREITPKEIREETRKYPNIVIGELERMRFIVLDLRYPNTTRDKIMQAEARLKGLE